MEINATNPLMVVGKEIQVTEAQTAGKARQPESTLAGGTKDRLEISDRSKDIARLDELIQSVPDVRDSVVDEVRFSIRNGTYNVKAEQIAEKMFGGALLDELL